MDNLKDFYVAGVVTLAAFLFWLNNYDKDKDLSKGARVRKLAYGSLGSAVTSWVCFEMLTYGGLPFRLSLALSAMVAYLGGEVMSKLLVRLLEKRIDRIGDDIGVVKDTAKDRIDHINDAK